jgi:signal transduction histidine kinase
MGLTPEILVSRLGDYLISCKLLTPEKLQFALDYQQEIREKNQPVPLLGQVLVTMGLIDRETLDQAITEQIIQLRTALEDSNKKLEERVHERTAELELALSRLYELNQLKSNFVANVTHELRTPLTHIKGYMELLINQSLGPLTDDQDQALQVMHTSSNRLERLIEGLLLFSMSERDQISLHIRPFYLEKLCLDLIGRLERAAGQKNIKVQFECPPDLPKIDADEEKVAWAILQLMDNAIKFSSDNSIVTLKIEAEGKFVSIAVIDKGIGFPMEKKDEIFEPFHQLDGSSTRRHGGAGLGLSLVKKIVEAHGSVIHVSSQLGLGSTFTFLLKLSEAT